MDLKAFKESVSKFRQELIGFKARHETTSQLISNTIGTMIPPPFGGFMKILWDGLKPDDKTADKTAETLVQVLTKIENQGQSFAGIENRIQTLIDLHPPKEEVLKIAQEIVTSSKSLTEILDKHLSVLNKIYKVVAKDSLSLLILNGNDSNIEEKIANAIDIKLSEPILTSVSTKIGLEFVKENEENIPFIEPNKFHEWQNENKLFLFGVPGSGKTRTMFEIVKTNLSRFNKIYVINPKKIGDEKVDRITIHEIVDSISDEDVIIWDNFPNDLPSGVLVESGLDSLVRVSSARVQNLFLTLDPSLSIYRKESRKIPDSFLVKQDITYDIEGIKKIIESYGNCISKYNSLYQKYIMQDIDRIAEILKDIEPTPLLVNIYFNELNKLSHSGNLSGVTAAQNLLSNTAQDKSKSRMSRFYMDQFQRLHQDNPNEAEFLYTIKLSYDFGFGRSLPLIKKLQMQIFHSSSRIIPSIDLTTWLYSSGPYYSMSDVARAAILMPPDRMTEVMESILMGFDKIVPTDSSSAYLFGKFIGENIQFLDYISSSSFLPTNVCEYMKKNTEFADALAGTVSKKFSSLRPEIIEGVLNLVKAKISIDFSFYLAMYIGPKLPTIKESQREKIFELAEQNKHFASGLGEELGKIFYSIKDSDLEEKIFLLIVKSEYFALRFWAWSEADIGYGFGSIKDKSLQNKILHLAEKNKAFAFAFGSTIGDDFGSVKDKDFQNKILHLAEKNKNLANGLSRRIGT